MIENRKTSIGFTETSVGEIKHLNRFGLDCPVVLKTWTDEDGGQHITRETKTRLPYPLLDDLGRMMFALPGGGRFSG